MNMIAAFEDTLRLACANGMDNMSSDNSELDYPHLQDMFMQMRDDANPQGGQFSEGKQGRWLGWAQAAVVASNCGTLEEMKEINKRWAE